MHLVIEKATQYQNTVSKYEAEIYIKGRTEILKQNMLIRLAHHIFPIDRKNKDMLLRWSANLNLTLRRTIFMI